LVPLHFLHPISFKKAQSIKKNGARKAWFSMMQDGICSTGFCGNVLTEGKNKGPKMGLADCVIDFVLEGHG
jgi:hypothetical protein